jgi:hypothetical protein
LRNRGEIANAIIDPHGDIRWLDLGFLDISVFCIRLYTSSVLPNTLVYCPVSGTGRLNFECGCRFMKMGAQNLLITFLDTVGGVG